MTSFAGLPCCACQAEWLPVLQAEAIRRGFIQRTIDFYQLIGGAKQSGGTHSTGGAFDVQQGQNGFIRLCRDMGADATWRRPKNWDRKGGIAHTHGVMRGCPHNGPARYQITSTSQGVDHGRNGLANYGADDGPRPLSKRSWSAGIKWAANQVPITRATKKWTVTKASTSARVYPGVGPVKAARKRGFKLTTTGLYRRKDGVLFARTRWGAFYDTRDLTSAETVTVAIRDAHFNLPAADKLANPEARADAAVRLIAKAAPAVIGFNELEPILSASRGSQFAGQIDKRLPGEWHWVKPTLPWNENYQAYRYDLIQLLAHKDVVLPGKTGGRHVTLAKYRDRASGFEWVRGVGHLVDGTTAAHEKDRQSQAKTAEVEARDFAGGLPVILSFDANTTAPLAALVAAGMKRTREYADESSTRNASTYTRYDKVRPDENPNWLIDQQYVDPAFYIVGYTVVRDLDAKGDYAQPRASDHDLIVSSIRTTHTK